MNLCSYGHEEVCYEFRKCPVCEAKEEIKLLTEQLKDANESAVTAINDLTELRLANEVRDMDLST